MWADDLASWLAEVAQAENSLEAAQYCLQVWQPQDIEGHQERKPGDEVTELQSPYLSEQWCQLILP